jgi:glc operon protein GlcG
MLVESWSRAMKKFTTVILAYSTSAVLLAGACQALAHQAPGSPATRAAPPARPAKVPRPTLSEALKALDAAVANAREAGISLSCAVVDVRGDLVAFVRMDDAAFLTASLAQGKALASALFGRPSADIAGMAASPFFASANAAVQNRIVPAQGAVPLLHEGHVIGAVGCSGGAPAQDEAAARAAQATL